MFCVSVCVSGFRCVDKTQGERTRDLEEGRDRQREVALLDKPHCHCHGLMLGDAPLYNAALSPPRSVADMMVESNCVGGTARQPKCKYCSDETSDI